MIHVLFISTCTKNALTRTVTILDSFAERIGEKTWQTFTTKQHLEKIVKTLRKKASKNTSIVVYIVKNNRKELYAKIGNTGNFYNGIVAHSYSQTQHDFFNINQSDVKRTILQIAYFSGLFHDLGKNNVIFQNKLRSNKKTRDLFRHEYLSGAILQGKTIESSIEFHKEFSQSQLSVKNVKDIIFFNVLSHHKTIPTQEKRKPFSADPEGFIVNREKLTYSFANKEDLEKSKTVKQAKPFSDVIDGALEAFKANETLKENIDSAVVPFIWFVSRTSLILADHNVSKEFHSEFMSKNSILANEKQILDDHLLQVAKEAKRVAEEIVGDIQEFQGLSEETRQKILSIPAERRFAYQQKAVRKIQSIEKKENGIDGAFIILGADTGFGKTVAGAKILTAFRAKGGARFNCLYGLVNLTRQTHRKYVQELGLKEYEAALVVGSLENEEAEKNYGNEIFGNETVYGVKQDLQIEFAKNEKMEILMQSPVVVGTIDYLMRGADWRKTKYIVPSLRAATSDSIIDEIDSFSVEDLQAIERLLYMQGMFGRKIVLSSATITKELAERLQKAYLLGYEVFKAINPNAKDIFYLFCANDMEPIAGFGDFEEKMDAFVRKKSSRKNKPTIMAKKMDLRKTDIFDQAVELHENNKELVNSGYVSIGVVRFASTKDSFLEMLRFMQKAKTQTRYRVRCIFFHSQTDFEVKSSIDAFLSQVLNRKKGSSSKLKSLAEKGKDSMYVVFTTPILEAGKDYDFDWGICEYITTPSTIQMAGRVNRHRRKEPEKENFALFHYKSRSMKSDPFKIDRDEKFFASLPDEFCKNISSSLWIRSVHPFDKEKENYNILLDYPLKLMKNENWVIGSCVFEKFPFRKGIFSVTFVSNKDDGSLKDTEFMDEMPFLNSKTFSELNDLLDEFLFVPEEVEESAKKAEDFINISFWGKEDYKDYKMERKSILYEKRIGAVKISRQKMEEFLI